MNKFQLWRATRAVKTLKKITANGKTSPRNYSPYSDSGSKYDGGTDDYNVSVEYNHQELRRKSRAAVFDSPPLAAIRERKTQSVVDTGVLVDPTPDFESIGISESEGQAFLRYAKGFNEWMGCKLQHRREQMTFFQSQSLAQSEKIRDGEYFFRAYYNYKDPELPHPLQWEALDADQIVDYSSTYTEDGFAETELNDSGNYPADGIKTDDRGRPIEYCIEVNRKGVVKSVKMAAKLPDGRYQIIHGFTPEYSFQKRGFPSLSKILQDTKELQDFSMAHIKKAINQSQKVYSVYNKDQDPTSPFDEKAFEETLGKWFEQTGDEEAEATPSETAIQYLNSPIFKNISLQTQPGSESLIMPEKGTEVRELENTAPVTQYDMFVGSYFSFLAAAENVPVEVVLMKFGQNYSASRATLILFFRLCEIERADLDSDLISPFYEMYLAVGIGQGHVTAPGWKDPRIRQWYIRHRTIGAPIPSIDPNREASAAVEQLGVGATSFTRNAQNLNGSDIDKNISENLIRAEKISKIRECLGKNNSGGP